MKKIFLLNVIFATTLLLSSCGGKCCKSDDENKGCQQTELTATALGTYSGTLPCADCSGIETTIVLNDSNSYTKVSKYLDKEELIINEEGAFTLCPKSNILTLVSVKNDTTYFELGENNITLLDANAKKPEGELAEHYVLNKK